MTIALELQQLKKTYPGGVQALRGIDLQVEAGDFYALLGYEVVYIGCNTPRDTLLNAVKTLRPDLVSISVTNYLNLAQLPAIIAALKALKPAPRVYIAGSALARTGKSAHDFGADGALTSFAAIREITEAKQ